ncbi:hypothetical protein I4641_15080 [Waterburya agarophytonicola K14]|uniref:Uncharacterized protein n=1 Tax=Waterburya agarophytonicola KI4 TaxID=2874699 RepID=A0A964FIN8_9CYAN|nr:hypothetical protein [Waterburya agarophytonicola]MCC0178303.1 hypothetical protein [Waterburya agarophytonicola KI4]
MRETTPTATPPCFDKWYKWCKHFDDLLRTKAQKVGKTDNSLDFLEQYQSLT